MLRVASLTVVYQHVNCWTFLLHNFRKFYHRLNVTRVAFCIENFSLCKLNSKHIFYHFLGFVRFPDAQYNNHVAFQEFLKNMNSNSSVSTSQHSNFACSLYESCNVQRSIVSDVSWPLNYLPTLFLNNVKTSAKYPIVPWNWNLNSNESSRKFFGISFEVRMK